MIVINARDPITLWQNLCSGWISGQEDWIEDRTSTRYYSYANLLSTHWLYAEIDGRLPELIRDLGLKGLKDMKIPPAPAYILERMQKDRFIEGFPMAWGHIDLVKKSRETQVQVHAYIRDLDVTCDFPSWIYEMDQLYKGMRLDEATPTVIHSTAFHFSRITMPLLMPILGKRAFFDYELSAIMNKDIQRLDTVIFKDDFKNKRLQAVWRHVIDVMGRK